MALLNEYRLYVGLMLALVAASAFFSCSEAALFSLQMDDRRMLRRGNAAQRTAIELLARPDRLLAAVLFWNLLVNLTYFTLASIMSVELERQDRHGEAAAVTLGALIGIILSGEMLPKTIGVQQPRAMASLLSLPLAASVRALDPVMPLFAAINNALQRLLFPNFTREPYLELSDLERAITLSTEDAQLAATEQQVLQNIMLLSELSAEEVMRPRTQYQAFTPPVHLHDLQGALPPSGYLLVTDPDSDEIAGVIALHQLTTAPRQHLENFARPVAYVPWCATMAIVLDELERRELEVAVVVNEYGETVGVVTLDDAMESLFEEGSSRSARLLATSSIMPAGEGRWHVTGMTTLRRLSRHFGTPLAPAQSVTVAGVLQELLQRMPAAGDEAAWGDFELRVIEADESRPLKVELRLAPGGGPLP